MKPIMSDKAEILTRFSRENLQRFRLSDEVILTPTTESQSIVEKSVWPLFQRFFSSPSLDVPCLHRQLHWDFLEQSIFYLPESYECLDASRPWLCYWILHALSLLGHRVSDELGDRVVQFLAKCQSASGGFGGGPGQLPHLASTYAAVNALSTIGSPAAFSIINRPGLLSFLTDMQREDGAFFMHRGGEVDIRGVYCAVAVAKLTNILTPSSTLFRNTAEWLVSCQTYEGGFSGFPGLEAHGGYTFCGLASLVLLKQEALCDISSLLRWVSCRQMMLEGGFSGRTNKLVDSCYSFWQGANFPLIQNLLSSRDTAMQRECCPLFDEMALQFYVLMCCQHPLGGFVDKPGKRRDFYHTCYALSGLSLAQNCSSDTSAEHSHLLGLESNRLEALDPLYNLRSDHLQKALCHFNSLPACHLPSS